MRAGRLTAFEKRIDPIIPTPAFDENPHRYFITFRVMLDGNGNQQDVYFCNRSGKITGLPVLYDEVIGISEDMGASCEIHLIGDNAVGLGVGAIIKGFFCEEQAKIPLKGRG